MDAAVTTRAPWTRWSEPEPRWPAMTRRTHVEPRASPEAKALVEDIEQVTDLGYIDSGMNHGIGIFTLMATTCMWFAEHTSHIRVVFNVI